MKITITDDFDPEKIIHSGQCFRAAMHNETTYQFITGKQILHLTRLNDTTWQGNCTKTQWQKTWEPYFDLSFNYKNIRKQIPANDIFLQKAATYGKGLRILRQDPFEMIITFIISQRKSIPAIKSAVNSLCIKAGTPFKKGNITYYTFPSPDALKKLSLEDLTACSLGYRAKYIYHTVRMITSRKINLSALYDLSDEQLHDILCTLPGVGHKVAHCISLFAFHRLNSAPVDVWINRVIEKHYEGQNPFPTYPYAGIMQQYMFYYAQTKKMRP